MDAKDIEAAGEALKKGVRWLSLIQGEDGTFKANAHNLRCYQKAALAFALCGYPSRAAKTIDVIKKRYLMPSGDLRTSEDYKYSDRPANLKAERARYLYTNGWICAAAHVTWTFDVSYPVAEYMLQCQDKGSGGFFSNRLELSDGEQDIASTASACFGLLFTGHTEQARKGGDFLLRMKDSQDEEQRFFLSFKEGVFREFSAAESSGYVVEIGKEHQSYWMLGFAGALLCLLYDVTSDSKYLEGARGYFDILQRAGDHAFESFGSWKGGWLASILYAITKDTTYAARAVTVLRYLVRSQSEDGSWPFALNIGLTEQDDDWTIDFTSEMLIWLSQYPGYLSLETEPCYQPQNRH